MTSRRPGQGLGAAREPGRLYSNEEPPPVPLKRGLGHLRPQAGAGRSPRPRGLCAVTSAACGREGIGMKTDLFQKNYRAEKEE
ncbi:hypothetical protein AB1E18_016995 [Capra hircus]